MAGEAKQTMDHEEIRRWVEERGGWPATVERTSGRGEAGLLRIDFPGYSGKQSLKRIEWDEFFDKFDEKHLVFLYQDQTATGEPSRFSKFIAGDGDSETNSGRTRSRSGSTTRSQKSTTATRSQRSSGRTRKSATGTRSRTSGTRTRSKQKTTGTRARKSTTGTRGSSRSRASQGSQASTRSQRKTSARSSRTRMKSETRQPEVEEVILVEAEPVIVEEDVEQMPMDQEARETARDERMHLHEEEQGMEGESGRTGHANMGRRSRSENRNVNRGG